MNEPTISADHLQKIKNWLGTGSINIFGLPFSGKDTHGHSLSKLFEAPLLSSGEVFRSSRDLLTPEDLTILDTGGLPPSDVFLKLFTPYFSKDEYKGNPLILSSVGRWIGEEQGILKAASDSGHPIKAVIYLHLSETIVYERLRNATQSGDRARPEDSEEHIQTRFNEFNDKTLPVIEEYRKLGLLIEVNSDATKSEVLESILARLFMKSVE
jgi:adenylate kinase family enzyme